jgi:thiol-disulfide isomerase/thioredoxin
MKKIITYIILWSLVAIGYAQQKQVDLTKQVRVGETMPTLDPQTVLFYKQDYINLDDYRNKVLILDFFDTFCSSCIASLPKLQKLQDEMGDQLQIVVITWQDLETIEKFWKTNTFIRDHQIHLPVIYSDMLLCTYFPHRGIPHVAWLYQHKVQAVTHSDFVTADNIRQLNDKGVIKLPLKYDFESEEAERLALGNIKGSVSMTRFQEGRPTASYSYQMDSLTGMYKTSFYNMPVFGAYTAVWSKIKKPDFILKPDRIVWEVKDSSIYKHFGSSGTGQIWLSQHGISYERYDQVGRNAREQAEIVLNDLNHFLGMEAYWSSRKMPAWIIQGKYKRPKNLATLDGQRMEGTSVLAFSLDMAGHQLPVVDQVKSKEILVLPVYQSINELNSHLKTYGLRIVKEIADVEVLIFAERE